MQATCPQQPAPTPSDGCTSGCTNSPENERGEAVGESVASKADGSVVNKPESLPSKGDSFSAGLMLIASLPLSDAEKADAVRRLMAEQSPLNEPSGE